MTGPDADWLCSPRVTGTPSTTDVDPPLLGRDQQLVDLVGLARARPGVIVIWGEAGVGRERLAREVATAIAGPGEVLTVPPRPGTVSERIEAALVAAERPPDIARAGRGRTLVVVVPDAEDEVDSQLTMLRDSPTLVLLCTTAPGTAAPSIHLPALDEDRARQLARAVNVSLDDSRASQIVALAEGMPGLIVALSRAAAAHGLGADLELPASIRQRALTALAGRTEDERQIARWVAVLHAGVDIELLAAIDDRERGWVEDRVDAMIRDGVLIEEQDATTLAFRRRVVGVALLAEMGPNELRRRHAAALEACRTLGRGPDQQVRHAVGAGLRDAIVDLALSAAESARGLNDGASAVRFADIADEWWRPEDGDVPRARAHRVRGAWLSQLGAWDDAAAEHERAATLFRRGRDESAAVDAAVASAMADWSRLEHRRALDRLVEFLERPDTAARSSARAEALLAASQFAGSVSLNAQSLDLARRARIEGVATGAPHPTCRSLALVGFARSGLTGRPSTAYFERARSAALALGDQRTASITYMWTTHMLLTAGRVGEVEALCKEGLAFADRFDLDDHEAVLIGNIGEARTAMGQLESARQYLDLAAQSAERLGLDRPTFADPGLGMLLVCEGRFEEAYAHYEGLLPRDGLNRINFPDMAGIVVGYAMALNETGAGDEARTVLRDAMVRWTGTDDHIFAVPVLALAAEVGLGALATEAAAHLARLSRLGVELAPPFQLLAAGHLARAERVEDAVRAYRAAVTEFDARGLSWWAARALLAAGMTQPESEAGAQDLLDARARFDAMPAPGWRLRAEAALRAGGRKIPSRGADATVQIAGLTTREEEVLRHLMTGASNRQVGERLFISDRTVARHVGEILNKLGVSRRAHAVEVARSHGLEPAEVITRSPAGD